MTSESAFWDTARPFALQREGHTDYWLFLDGQRQLWRLGPSFTGEPQLELVRKHVPLIPKAGS